MSPSSGSPRVPLAEWIITIALMVVMAAAYIAALDWPRGTAFFPLLLSGAGFVLALVKVVSMLAGSYTASPARGDAELQSENPPVEDGEEKSIVIAGPDDDDQGDEAKLHKVFEGATTRQWLGVLGWVGGFFLGLYVVGLPVTLCIFTIAYLMVVARISLMKSVVYLVCTTGILYFVMVRMLHLPLPEGVIGDLF